MKIASFLLPAIWSLGLSPLVAQEGAERHPLRPDTLLAEEMWNAVSAPDSGAPLSLFLEQALKANPGLQSARSRAEASASKTRQLGAWDDPQVGIEFYATPVTSANPFKDGMETDYFIQQMIPLFGSRGLMSDAAAAGARMAGESANAVERELIADVKKAYGMLYAVQRRMDANRENQRLLREIAASATTRYRVGLLGQSDLLKAQVEIAKLQNEQSGLDQELANASAMMNALRGLPAFTPIGRVQEPLLVQTSLSREDLLAQALETRPELRAAGHELEMSRAELAASKRERLPDLMIRGTYKQMAEGTDMWAAMFSVNIPIAPWASGRSSGKVEERQLLERATEQSIIEMRNKVQAEVLDAYARVTSRWEKIERFRQRILPQSEQALRSAQVAFQTGKVDFLSLLDNYRMLQMLKMEYYMTIGEYVAGVAQLEKTVGTELH